MIYHERPRKDTFTEIFFLVIFTLLPVFYSQCRCILRPRQVLSESDNDENGDFCEVATQEDMDNW